MIVVTTPTGAIGSRVVTNLLDRGAAVRVVVRDPARLPGAVRDRVDVVAGSHGDPDVVAKAFAGADAVGPEDLSGNDMARIMSEVLDGPVRCQVVSDEAFTAPLLAHGMSEAMARAMLDMMRAKDNGLDNAEERTPENTTPTSFRQWCEEVLKPAVA